MSRAVAIFGSSGYAGGELIRLIDGHPYFVIAYLGAHTAAGKDLGSVHPHLSRRRSCAPAAIDPSAAPDVDLAFLALPHGASAEPAMDLLDRGIAVVDIGSDFRLDTPERYVAAYESATRIPTNSAVGPTGSRSSSDGMLRAQTEWPCPAATPRRRFSPSHRYSPPALWNPRASSSTPCLASRVRAGECMLISTSAPSTNRSRPTRC